MLIDGINNTAGSAVTGAIRDAARATGATFEYLLATARVESGLDPNASAKTSSARGLFQFIDQTWLATLKQAGPSLGYGRYADAIVRTPSGRLEVPDPQMRREILDLRGDATANAAMAGAFTNGNAARLAEKLGRSASDGELYIAHFLGASGAARLITLAANSPDAPAASMFPNAANANRSIFYDSQGHARSASEVYGVLVGRFDVARTAAANSVASAQPAAINPVTGRGAASIAMDDAGTAPTSRVVPFGPALRGPLASDERRGAISPIVRDLWASRPGVAAALTGGLPAKSPQPIDGTSPVTPVSTTATIGGLFNLFGDLPANVRALFTSRS